VTVSGPIEAVAATTIRPRTASESLLVSINQVLGASTAPEQGLSAETLHRELQAQGVHVPSLEVLRTYLSAGRNQFGWERTRERPTRWYRPLNGRSEDTLM
jgi:hypothetical protein